jgi:hypothetical protein
VRKEYSHFVFFRPYSSVKHIPLDNIFSKILLARKKILRRESRGGHAQLFFESAIATPQLEGSTSATAIPQLFKEFCSATPQFRNRNFFEVRNFKSAT